MPCLDVFVGALQALVQHGVATGAAAVVERCVLRLDITTLDLNQVLCLMEVDSCIIMLARHGSCLTSSYQVSCWQLCSLCNLTTVYSAAATLGWCTPIPSLVAVAVGYQQAEHVAKHCWFAAVKLPGVPGVPSCMVIAA